MKGPDNIWRYDPAIDHTKREKKKWKGYSNISRGMLSIFFVRFTCPGPFYTPLPSFQAHPSLFVSLMTFSSLPTFALSPYQSICALYTFNTICLPIALHHVHFLSSRHLIIGTLVLIHLRRYPFSTVLHCEKNIVSEIKEKKKTKRREMKNKKKTKKRTNKKRSRRFVRL